MKPLRILGHPIHPITVHLPMGLLITTTALHVAALGGLASAEIPARWTLGLGVAAGMVAACFGALDLLTLPKSAEVERRVTTHLALMTSALSCYGAAFVLYGTIPGWAGVCLVLLGLLVLAAGGWAGAELVYGHGVGVRPIEGGESCESRGSPAPVGKSSSR